MSRQLEVVGPLGASSDAHVVRFYDQDPELVEAVARYLVPALSAGAGVLVLATASHMEAIDRALAASGIDVTTLVSHERYVALDADAVLERVMRNGAPDGSRFRAEVGTALDALGRYGSVYAFGELVALLWQQGNVAAAIRIEELWNELGQTRDLRLLCAYPMSGFESYPDPHGFEEICRSHDQVVSAQSYEAASALDGGFSRVVALEQKARTDRLEIEALKLKQAQLEEALERESTLERMRSEFVAMAVHDIRTPAAVVAGFLQVLRKNWRAFNEEAVQELLAKGIHQTQRIQHLVDDLLTVAEVDAGGFAYNIQPFDMNAVIDEAVVAARESSPRITFDIDVPHLLRPARGDESRQIQILNNLLSNAAKFSPPGSHVRVALTERPSDIMVHISDEGVGITPEDVPKLFKTFSRLRPAGYEGARGTGLGLYICKALVEGQNGAIGIEPGPRGGTVVWYTVPRA